MNFRRLLELKIPFTFIDHYEVYMINCTDKEVIRQSEITYVNKIQDVYNLHPHDRYVLKLMLQKNLELYQDY